MTLLTGSFVALVLMAGGSASAGNQAADEEGFRGSDPASRVLPSVVRSRMEAQFGPRMAGLWIDPAHSTYVVALVSPSQEDRERVRRLVPETDRVQVVQGRFSAVALADLSQRVKRRVYEVHRGASAVFAHEPDQEVVVNLDAIDPVVVSELEREDDLGALRIVEGYRPGTDLHSSLTSWPPYESALRVTVNGGGCTSNFIVHNTTYGHFGTTAGHCGPLDSPVVHGSTTVDRIRGNALYEKNPTNSDSAVYLLSAANATTRFYRGVDLHRTVSGKYNNADQTVGWRVCQRGATTNQQVCGDVTLANVQYVDVQGITVNQQYCHNNLTADRGDSGAPLYRVQGDGTIWAAGVVKGIYNPDQNGTNDLCYSTINSVLNRFSSTLWLG
jgi:hypothetical protein